MTLNVLLVDDEPMALRRLRGQLSGLSGISIRGEAATATEALAVLADRSIDVVLCDIDMPGMNGIDLTRHLASRPGLHVVFVTAHDSYAVQAFDLDCVDYLLKPVEPGRLAASMARVRRRIAATADRSAGFWVSQGAHRRRIAVETVIAFTAERDYVRLHAGGQAWLVRATLGAIEAGLSSGFVRISRSAVVRRDAVSEIIARGDRAYEVRLERGPTLRASRAYAAAVRAMC